MILADTSVWIEFLRQHDKALELQLAQELEKSNVIAISPVFGELLQGVKSAREERIVIDLWEDLMKVNESQIFIEAGRLSFGQKLYSKGLGLVDCAILCVAKTNNLKIWSLDKKLIEAGKSLTIPIFEEE